MSSFEFKLNYQGVGELLKSSAMGEICAQHASDMASRCGEGYEADSVSTYVGKTRVNASVVVARSEEAQQDNLDNNTLLKQLGA